MASNHIEVAQAFVTIIPSMEGAQKTITKEMTGAVEPAGKAAGEKLGKITADSLGKSLSKSGKALSIGVTAPLAAIGTGAVKAFKEVDAGLDTIVMKTGASGAALEGMSDILKNITSEIPTDFETAGAAIGEVNTRFDVTGEELQALSTQFIEFAAINNTDVSGSIDTVQKALSAFGLEAEYAGTVLDTLNATGQATGASVDTLANGLVQNGTAFQELGLSIEQSIVLMGQLETSGANSETVMQGLRKALKNAAKDGVPLKQALSDLQTTIVKGKDGMDGLTAAYDIFGKSGDQIYGAVKNGTLDFKNLGDAFLDFSGSVSTTYGQTLDPMDKMAIVMNDLKVAGADLINAIGPSLSSALTALSEVVKKLADGWSNLSPQTQKFIIGAGAVAASIGPILAIAGKAIGLFTTLQSGLAGLGGHLGDLAGKLGSFGPAASQASTAASAAGTSFQTMAGQAVQLLALGAAVALIGAGMWVLADAAVRLTEAGPVAIGVFVGMAAIAVGVAAGIAAIGSAATATAPGLLALGAAVALVSVGIAAMTAAAALLVNQITALVQVCAQNADGIVQIIDGAADAINSTIQTIGLTIAAIIQTSYAAVADGISQIIQTVGNAIGGIVTSITDGIANINNSIANVLDSLAGVIDSIGTAALNAGKGFDILAGAVINLVANTNIADLAATLTAVSVGIKAINKAAEGSDAAAASVIALGVGLAALAVTGESEMSRLEVAITAKLANIQARFAETLANIKSLFASTKLEFNQSIALPHFKMSGTFDAKTGAVPTVGVDWYRRAATQGALFSDPTVIGVGDASQPELLIGEQTLYQNIQEAAGDKGDIVIPVYLGGEMLDTLVVKANQRAVYRSGGH